jgi:hypothetical protein
MPVSGRRTRKVPRSSAATKDDWVIAIPSYRRATTLRDKTLKTLAAYKIPTSRIHVFVANEEEHATYKETLTPGSYGHLHIAEKGMAAVRNYITRFFPVGKPIFNMDDDITGFLEYSATARRNERPLRSLSTAITAGFAAAHRTGYRLFGFYPVANGYFMRPGAPTTDLRYIIGAVWGILNPGPVLTVTIDDKEDYLRTVMMYVLDGGVLRFNNIAPKTAYYKEPGGMQETRTMSRISDSAKAMVAAFPDLVKINLTKRSGMPEVRLRDSRPEAERRFGVDALKAYTLPHVSKTHKT